MNTGPVFMFCVGATKAGTTWVHRQLRSHPECHLRTIKEYHYFSNSSDADWAKLRDETSAEIERLIADPSPPNPAYAVERLHDLQGFQTVLAPGDIDIDLFRAHLLDGIGDRKLVGDFTPVYSVIRGKRLERLLEFGPMLRVVYLIRDPLARLWSHIRMSADRRSPDDFEKTARQILRRTLAGERDLGIQGILRRGDYAGNLPKLKQVFGKDRLLVMFTEEVMTEAGYARLLQFLGLSAQSADLDTPVHAGRAMDLPQDLRAQALRFLRPQYDYIASEFSDLPSAWRRNMNEAMA